jgi:MFS family permease
VAPVVRRGGFARLLGASAITNLGDGVGVVAYPWLASLVTRDPALVAAVVAAQRLPWLVVTLPAGVWTDRLDRRRVIVASDLFRGAVTLLVATVVSVRLAAHADPAGTVGTDVALYGLVVGATVAVGCAEVVRDNAAQTLLPSVVAVADLERANGRLWVVELLTNTFAGPVLGAWLVGLGVAYAVGFDAVSFLLAALVVTTLPGAYRAVDDRVRRSWWAEAREGLGWLWSHELLRPLALVLGAMNLASTVSLSTLVLYSQDVLGGGALGFAAVTMGGGAGGVVAGLVAGRVLDRVGPGRSLVVVIAGCAAGAVLVGSAPGWPVAAGAFVVTGFLGTVWNVATVSLRQAIIPSDLLGRVNSVYRMIAWGAMPVGAVVGGAVVTVASALSDRETALRATWFVEAAVYLALLTVAPSRLTAARIERARAEAATRRAAAGPDP